MLAGRPKGKKGGKVAGRRKTLTVWPWGMCFDLAPIHLPLTVRPQYRRPVLLAIPSSHHLLQPRHHLFLCVLQVPLLGTDAAEPRVLQELKPLNPLGPVLTPISLIALRSAPAHLGFIA